MKFSTRDPIVAEIRETREKNARRLKRDPQKYWDEFHQMERDVKKYGLKAALKMHNKKAASSKK